MKLSALRCIPEFWGGVLHIDISSQEIELQMIGGLLRQRVTRISHTSDTENYSLEEEEHLGRCLSSKLASASVAGRAVKIILPDECVRFFMVTPPNNMQKVDDCRAAAEMRFRTLYDAKLADWSLQADWNVQSFLACAVPNSLLRRLESILRERKLFLISVTPKFISMYNYHRHELKDDAWVGVVHGNVLSLGIIDDERLLNVRTIRIFDDADENGDWLQAHISREALRLNVKLPTRIQLCGMSRQKWNTSSASMIKVDFIQGKFAICQSSNL